MTDKLTPGMLRNEPIHTTNCRRFNEGMMNTTGSDCTCFIGKYAKAWEVSEATIASLLEVLPPRVALSYAEKVEGSRRNNEDHAGMQNVPAHSLRKYAKIALALLPQRIPEVR